MWNSAADALMRCAWRRGCPFGWFWGWLNTSVPSNPPECAGVNAHRDLTYDSRPTPFTPGRHRDRRRRRAAWASFAKKKRDVACQGPDVSPGGRRCAWCESLEKSIFPRGWCTREVARQPLVSRYLQDLFYKTSLI